MQPNPALKVEHIWQEAWLFWKKHAVQALLVFLPAYALTIVFPAPDMSVPTDLLDALALVLTLVVTAWAGVSVLALYRNGGTVGEAFRAGLTLWPHYLLLTLISGLLIAAGFIVFVVPGVFLLVLFSMAPYAFLWEGKRGIAALEASRTRVRGRFWRVLGLLLIALVATIVASTIVNIVGFIIAAFGDYAYPVGAQLADALGMLVITPWLLAYMLSVYRGLGPPQAEPSPEDLRRNHRRLTQLLIIAVIILALFAWFVLPPLIAWLSVPH